MTSYYMLILFSFPLFVLTEGQLQDLRFSKEILNFDGYYNGRKLQKYYKLSIKIRKITANFILYTIINFSIFKQDYVFSLSFALSLKHKHTLDETYR